MPHTLLSVALRTLVDHVNTDYSVFAECLHHHDHHNDDPYDLHTFLDDLDDVAQTNTTSW